jgi:hypothetical protein
MNKDQDGGPWCSVLVAEVLVPRYQTEVATNKVMFIPIERESNTSSQDIIVFVGARGIRSAVSNAGWNLDNSQR